MEKMPQHNEDQTERSVYMKLQVLVAQEMCKYAPDIESAVGEWAKENSVEYSKVMKKLVDEGVDIVAEFENNKDALIARVIEVVEARNELAQ